MFLGKGVLKIWSKFTGEHPCRSAISIKLQSNVIEITLPHGCSPVNFGAYFQNTFFLRTPLDGCFCCIQDWEMEKSVDSSKTFTVLLSDLSKAFDGLPHDFIFTKLNAYVFNLSSSTLIHSYLSNRKQRTKISSAYSTWKEILFGVRQDSILRSLLFNNFYMLSIFHVKQRRFCQLSRWFYIMCCRM